MLLKERDPFVRFDMIFNNFGIFSFNMDLFYDDTKQTENVFFSKTLALKTFGI